MFTYKRLLGRFVGRFSKWVFTFVHLVEIFILYVEHSLEIEPVTLALLVACFSSWATKLYWLLKKSYFLERTGHEMTFGGWGLFLINSLVFATQLRIRTDCIQGNQSQSDLWGMHELPLSCMRLPTLGPPKEKKTHGSKRTVHVLVTHRNKFALNP